MRVSRLALFAGAALLLAPAVQAQGIATGFSIWTRILETNTPTIGTSTAAVALSPTFVVGYQGNSFAIGLAIATARLQTKDDDGSGNTDEELTTVWQVGPSAQWHFWKAPSGMTRANAILEVTFGKASDTFTQTGSTTGEVKASGTVYGGRIGVGGDHFFDEHFGVGIEAGFDLNRISGFGVDGSSAKSDLTTTGAYGALRATVIL